MNEPKYVVTAVNNLTGEREAISRPHSYRKTELMLKKARRDQRRHHGQAAYSNYRMQLWDSQQAIQFSPPLKSGLPECICSKSVHGKVVFSASGKSDYFCTRTERKEMIAI